jgi:hypothetical protein
MECKLKLEKYSIMLSINLLLENNSHISVTITLPIYTVKTAYCGRARKNYSALGKFHFIQEREYWIF